jgi:hypothetical protein
MHPPVGAKRRVPENLQCVPRGRHRPSRHRRRESVWACSAGSFPEAQGGGAGSKKEPDRRGLRFRDWSDSIWGASKIWPAAPRSVRWTFSGRAPARRCEAEGSGKSPMRPSRTPQALPARNGKKKSAAGKGSVLAGLRKWDSGRREWIFFRGPCPHGGAAAGKVSGRAVRVLSPQRREKEPGRKKSLIAAGSASETDPGRVSVSGLERRGKWG